MTMTIDLTDQELAELKSLTNYSDAAASGSRIGWRPRRFYTRMTRGVNRMSEFPS